VPLQRRECESNIKEEGSKKDREWEEKWNRWEMRRTEKVKIR